jgi:hypothetical protein
LRAGVLLARVRQDIQRGGDTAAWARACFDLEEPADVQLELKVRANFKSANFKSVCAAALAVGIEWEG